MADSYNPQQESRRKYLVPLVLLMLCAAALTGAGYAYSSTVTSGGNQVTGDSMLLSFENGSSARTLSFNIDFDSETVDGKTIWTVNTGKSELSSVFRINLTSTENQEVTAVLFADTVVLAGKELRVTFPELTDNKIMLTSNRGPVEIRAELSGIDVLDGDDEVILDDGTVSTVSEELLKSSNYNLAFRLTATAKTS